MDVAQLRDQFPGAERRVHFNAAGLGIVSRPAAEAIRQFLEVIGEDPPGAYRGGHHERARAAAARLIGARPQQIALTPATSLALNVAADALPLAAGDNIVTCDLEFMSVIVPFLEKARACGAELRVVRHRGGAIDEQEVVDRIDMRTRAVVLSAVQWTNGFRLDLASIGAACRRRGIPFICDAIQQLGVVPLDVAASGVDYLVCGGHKWLGSPTALGFAYASDGFAARYRPSLSYAPTAQPPGGDWLASWTYPAYDPIRTYELAPDASRFELGVHHAALGAAGLAAALELLEAVGIEPIAAQAIRLAGRVAEGLAALGFEVATPSAPERRAGITSFRAGAEAADDVAMREFLLMRGVDTAVRFTSGIGGVRVSTHGYNNDADVDRLLEAVGEWVKRR